MCMLMRERKALTAAEGIECYKVLVRLGSSHWVSPYMMAQYTEFVNGREYRPTRMPRWILRAVLRKGMTEMRTEGPSGTRWHHRGDRLAHTYARIEDAKAEALETDMAMASNRRFRRWEVGVFRCTVPRGSVYLEGVTALGRNAYASDRLRIGECVHTLGREALRQGLG